jgi:membrane-anchored protein YejM (alkaline phosphatase superfamily)
MTLGALLVASSLLGCTDAPAPVPAAPSPPPQHLILIVVDTLRADVLDELNPATWRALVAAGGKVPRAWSPGTWTLPSVIGLFTGMSVRQHGWDLPTGKFGRYPKLPEAPLLAGVLHEEGFRTTGLYANPYLAEDLGLADGFQTWRRVPDKAMVRELKAELAKGWRPGERQFLYLHLLGPHSPLKPSDAAKAKYDLAPELFDPRIGFELGAAQRNTPVGANEAYPRGYRAAVEEADGLVGELLEVLAPYRQDALVVLTSDHGEMLGDHGFFGHGTWVWESLTHVPLAVDGPGVDPPLPATMNVSEIAQLATARRWSPSVRARPRCCWTGGGRASGMTKAPHLRSTISRPTRASSIPSLTTTGSLRRICAGPRKCRPAPSAARRSS